MITTAPHRPPMIRLEDFGIDRERDSRHFDEYYERFGIRRDT